MESSSSTNSRDCTNHPFCYTNRAERAIPRHIRPPSLPLFTLLRWGTFLPLVLHRQRGTPSWLTASKHPLPRSVPGGCRMLAPVLCARTDRSTGVVVLTVSGPLTTADHIASLVHTL